jgi:hypothetical protein
MVGFLFSVSKNVTNAESLSASRKVLHKLYHFEQRDVNTGKTQVLQTGIFIHFSEYEMMMMLKMMKILTTIMMTTLCSQTMC